MGFVLLLIYNYFQIQSFCFVSVQACDHIFNAGSRGKSIIKYLTVCNYGPAGNYYGEKPYINGKAGSKCSSGSKCFQNVDILKEVKLTNTNIKTNTDTKVNTNITVCFWCILFTATHIYFTTFICIIKGLIF